jgi:hypothetical protein
MKMKLSISATGTSEALVSLGCRASPSVKSQPLIRVTHAGCKLVENKFCRHRNPRHAADGQASGLMSGPISMCSDLRRANACQLSSDELKKRTTGGTKLNTTNDSRTGLSWATLKLTDVYASYQPEKRGFTTDCFRAPGCPSVSHHESGEIFRSYSETGNKLARHLEGTNAPPPIAW